MSVEAAKDLLAWLEEGNGEQQRENIDKVRGLAWEASKLALRNSTVNATGRLMVRELHGWWVVGGGDPGPGPT